VIIGASRRTDIPAFHSGWFMDRLRAGHALVRNPGYGGTVFRVPLSPADVDAIVFMTKDPRPMEAHLAELESMGHEAMFQVTVTGYGGPIEPNVPPAWKVVRSMAKLSDALGPERLVWRYDPVLFGGARDAAWHIANFDRLSKALEGVAGWCVIGFFEPHLKLSGAMASGLLKEARPEEKAAVATPFKGMAESRGMRIRSCCTGDALAPYGILDGGCVGGDMLSSIGIPWEKPSAPNRKGCLCVKTVDIGTYDTCPHRCVYCYANSKGGRGESRPGEEMLADALGPTDVVVEVGGRPTRLRDFR